jgi:glycosyltransferase involved in cell wall biosynthesis
VRIAFIVQRYGTEILGGSEYHCRLIAERMAQRHDVTVLTTCARDYVSWRNEYPEGDDRVRGVTVRRFPNAETRDIASFNRYSDWIFTYPHTSDDEMAWLRRQGPWSPALLEHLRSHHESYDVLIFFTYLYAPTVLGLRIAPERSILVPTAHDEPAIHLGIYRDVFAAPAGVAFNTDVERRFLLSTFDIRARGQETVGCGVDLPPDHPGPRPRPEDEDPVAPREEATPVARGRPSGGRGDRRRENRGRDARRHGDPGDGTRRDDGPGQRGPGEEGEGPPAWRDDDVTEVGRFKLGPRGGQFRRRYRLYGDFVLYGGRIDPGKGCEELFEYFGSYVKEGGEGTLALMGVKLMNIPDAPWVRFAGMLPEVERLQALEAATVVSVPSPFESLSLLALESFAVGTPILANARSEVLVQHCRSSNAGLWYADRAEFVEALSLLMADAGLRAAMGHNGKDYVRRHYRWDVILGKYDQLIAQVRNGTGARVSGAGRR